MFNGLSLSQKILFGGLYSLLALMVVFSILARGNVGEDGLQKCLNRVVDRHKDGSLYESFKVVNNCCVGAGGKIAWSAEKNTHVCNFN